MDATLTDVLIHGLTWLWEGIFWLMGTKWYVGIPILLIIGCLANLTDNKKGEITE